jgi:hypothetical protein
MKSRILLLTVVLTLGFTVNAFAAAGTMAWLAKAADGSFAFPVTGSVVVFNIRPSANVWIGYGAETTGVAYGLATLHSSGTFTYATTSTDTNIYRYENTNQSFSAATGAYNGSGVNCPATPADATSQVAWGAGWTASK